MSITENRKVVLGFTLCADPAREPCFKVAQTDEEMTKWEGTNWRLFAVKNSTGT
jgi:hypothetical protein